MYGDYSKVPSQGYKHFPYETFFKARLHRNFRVKVVSDKAPEIFTKCVHGAGVIYKLISETAYYIPAQNLEGVHFLNVRIPAPPFEYETVQRMHTWDLLHRDWCRISSTNKIKDNKTIKTRGPLCAFCRPNLCPPPL